MSKIKNMGNPHVLPLSDPSSPFLQPYRRLFRKVLRAQQEHGYRSFGITSAQMGEGKTLTCINLALVMSEHPTKKVVLVECDFRKPQVGNYLGLQVDTGLAEVLRGEYTLSDVLVTLRNDAINLHVLTAGRVQGDPVHVFQSEKLSGLITTLKGEYDFLIVDTPPVMPIADQAFLSDLIDGMILVIRAGKTPRDLVKAALESMESTRVVGVILNGYDRHLSNYYSYKYYSYYSSTPYRGRR